MEYLRIPAPQYQNKGYVRLYQKRWEFDHKKTDLAVSEKTDGYFDTIHIEKNNIRLLAPLKYAKDGTLEQKLKELFPELVSEDSSAEESGIM